MWILRYLILATRQRSNFQLDQRTRMAFDPLHGCPIFVCRDKDEWDRRGKAHVAQLESELRQDIEAYNTETHERRVIRGETIEVRPVVLAAREAPVAAPVPETEEPQAEGQEQILPEAAPETEAAPVSTGDALVSSGVEAQAEAEPGAVPTFLEEAGEEVPQEDGKPEPEKKGEAEAEDQNQNQSQLQTGAPSTEGQNHLASGAPSSEVKPKARTKPAGKAGKK